MVHSLWATDCVGTGKIAIWIHHISCSPTKGDITVLAKKLNKLLGRSRPSLTFRGANGSQDVMLTQDAPLITIVGGQQSGKSVLALTFAEQLLEQGYAAAWFTHSRLVPGDEGYMESKASRLALHLESHNRDTFHIQVTDGVEYDELAYMPRKHLIIIDDMQLLEKERATSSKLIQWASQNGSIVVLVAAAPEDFFRIGLTDRHTKGVSLMLIGRLALNDQSSLPGPLQNRLSRIRFLRDKYAEYLAISPNRNWSEVITVDLPNGI